MSEAAICNICKAPPGAYTCHWHREIAREFVASLFAVGADIEREEKRAAVRVVALPPRLTDEERAAYGAGWFTEMGGE